MDNSKFFGELAKYIKSRDTQKANRVIMRELAIYLIKDKSDFIEVLRNANIPVPDNASDIQLVNAFIDNAPSNRNLLLGASFLISHKNQVVGADGESAINDSGMKATYKVMYEYFDANQYDDTSDTVNEDYLDADGESDDEFYYAGGGLIGSLLEVGGGIANKIMDTQKMKKFGSSETLAKQQEAKRQMIQQIMEQKKAKQEEIAKANERKAKTTKTVLIVVGSLVAIALIVGVVYAIKKKK